MAAQTKEYRCIYAYVPRNSYVSRATCMKYLYVFVIKCDTCAL